MRLIADNYFEHERYPVISKGRGLLRRMLKQVLN